MDEFTVREFYFKHPSAFLEVLSGSEIFDIRLRALSLVLLSLVCILIAYALANSSAWPRIGTMGKGHGAHTSLTPIDRRYLGGICNILDFLTTSELFRLDVPLRLKWLGLDCYVVQGAANIRSTFQNKGLSTFFFQGLFVHRVFHLPKQDLHFFDPEFATRKTLDQPTRHGLDEVRSSFGTRSFEHIGKLLAGPGKQPLYTRFDAALSRNLRALNQGQGWLHFADLKQALDIEISRSFIQSSCSPYLLRSNPTFLKDLQIVGNNVTPLFMGLPWLFMPKVYRARDRIFNAVQEWNEWAAVNFDPNSISEDGYDPYWGHAFYRERGAMYADEYHLSTSSIASHNVSFLWGSTANSSPAAFWAILDVFRNPQLLRLVRKEAIYCLEESSNGGLRFDMERVLKQPVIQAVIAETLRLRVHGIIPRKCPPEGINVRGSVIPGSNLFFMNSTTEHMDPKVWSTGRAKDHPPEEFWPGRFLWPPKNSPGEFVFSMSGKSGEWIPFGGGAHMCPGRFLAKRTIAGCLAHMVTTYDMEIIDDKAALGMSGMSLRTFGLGTLHPAGSVSVRLRSRQIE